MIQENEIMIGNYLQVAEDVSGFDKPYMQVKSIEPGKINREEKYDLDIEVDFEEFFTPNELYGIPLSCNLIEKLGLKYAPAHEVYFLKGYLKVGVFYNTCTPSFWISILYEGMWVDAYLDTHQIKYVHELQNFIKMYTGENLTLS